MKPGLYEALITERLKTQLDSLSDRLKPHIETLHKAEVANRIALHLSHIIERSVESVAEDIRVSKAVELANDLVEKIDEHIQKANAKDDAPLNPAAILQAILTLQPDGSTRTIPTPLTPLLDTTLLTNAPGEPRIGRQVQVEIESADRIDMVMAFIRRSGLNPLLGPLRDHCAAGRTLRVLTTTYTGSTEGKALELLRDLGAEIRVSYDTKSTRLHAKSWLFHRHSGFSTAYIGSSNLTHSAQVTGLEWNVRVSGARNPDVIQKVAAVFDTYWESDDFERYEPAEFEKRVERAQSKQPTILISPTELRPRPFQERLLEQIAVARERGRHRNLLVAATGTGKTVMAALDYLRLRKKLPRARLLFVAHRKEILDQSQVTFCQALRDPSFGEKWAGGRRPGKFDHVFASIQSLSHADLDLLEPDHFDVVIVDEFHHAAAPTYDRLLSHVRPKELLGLTATPERADGQSVLEWFDGRIAAELRLWDAIDQHHLSPFHYFGVHDDQDLREVPWKRGRGYDVEALTNVYTSDDRWAHLVIKQVHERADDWTAMRALGFCVSVRHAQFLARKFNEAGIAAVAVWGESPVAEREEALRDLRDGKIRVLFSVDLFNEGVDLPDVDTLLLLRPTDSPTLFLQQLGRGLRRTEGKSVCTVIDFVGSHRKEYRFDRRFRALLGGTRKELATQVKGGFPFLPAGCHMELDRVAQQEVLRSIRESVPSRWDQKVGELRAMVAGGHRPSLGGYLEQSGLELTDVYGGADRCWSRLLENAGEGVLPAGPEEAALRRAVGRLLHVDDPERLDGYERLVSMEEAPDLAVLTERERRLARMLGAQAVGRVVGKDASVAKGLALLWRHPQVLAELKELFGVLRGGIDHVHERLKNREDVPLLVHGRYTRLEILAAMGVGEGAQVAPWQTGVRWVPEAKADLFAFTLDKTSGSFSPTTRYRDYALSRELLHWESQSVTRADSATGRRYQRHVEMGTDVLLFARLRQADRAFWFLGPAEYVRHEGERPMGVVWRLRHGLSGDLFSAFAAAVA